MKKPTKSLVWATGVLAAATLATFGSVAVVSAADATEEQSFDRLKPEVDIVYLLANSSLIVGADVEGPAEDITFTGTVAVPKYPVEGFDRRQLPSGRYQIDFELTDSQLRGESYLMDGPVLLGEHPDLRSLGTITQAEDGQDYPANFIVQRKVLIETPKGQMYNEEPVPVRGRINSIPPVRAEPDGEETNVFRGKELPIALLDESGELTGWFYSTVHVAYAVDPVAIYRVDLAGTIEVEVDGKKEAVNVQGPVEILEQDTNGGKVEVVMLALRGESELLGGPIMVTESFHPEKEFSFGRLGSESAFDLHLEIKTPSGIVAVEEPVHTAGSTSPPTEIGAESLGNRGTVPVFALGLEQSGGEQQALIDEAGRRIGSVSHLHINGKMKNTGRRPCCPLEPSKATSADTKASLSGSK